MRKPFIDFIAQSVRSGSDGSMAMHLWDLTSDGDLYHEEALRIALEAATNSCNPDLLYGVAHVVGKEHPSYPNLINRFMSLFWKLPSQSAFEKLLKALGKDHPEFDSVLEFANKLGLRLSEEHQSRRKAEAARKRQSAHQQRQLCQRAKSSQRQNHLASMKWLPVERLAYITAGNGTSIGILSVQLGKC